MLKEKRTDRHGHKIGPANRSEVLIEFRKDEESAEKEKEFQPSDFVQKTDNRRIWEKCTRFSPLKHTGEYPNREILKSRGEISAFWSSGLGAARGHEVTALQSPNSRNPKGIHTIGSGARWPESHWIKEKEERYEPSNLALRIASHPFWRIGVEDLYLQGIRIPGHHGGRIHETRSPDSRNCERRSKSIGTSGTGRSRSKIQKTGSLSSQIPENIMIVHKDDTWQCSRFRGNLPKEHFGISSTENAKGKSSGLLTHEIQKGSEPSDQRRLTVIDLPQEWSFGISEFGTSVFWIPKVRRVRNWSRRIREVSKR
jgi:hypothetical protein